MKKKRIIIATIIVVAIALLTVILFSVFNKKDKNQDYITRDEWISMLCTEMGIEDYKTDYENYSKGEDFATGEFVALSAMKVISEDKMQIYLNTDKEITNDVYLDTALELKLVKESELDKYCSPVVALEVAKNIKNMYYNEFWPDDYEVVEYKDTVIEMTSENILEYASSATSMVVTDSMLDEISEDSVIVFEDDKTGLKCARKVVSKSENGTIELSDDVKMEEVFDTLVVSDIDELTFEDIVGYNGVEEAGVDESLLTYENVGGYIETTKKFSDEIKSEGYVISLSKDEDSNKLLVEIENNETGKSSEIKTNVKLDEDDNCSLEIDIEEIYIGAQVKYTFFGGLEYVDVTVGAVSTITGSIDLFETEKTIPLFKTPAPLGNGIVGVDIEISLVIAADGSVSFVAEIPIEASVSYEKGKKIKKPTYDINVDEPEFEANCSASASLCLEPTLVILSCIDVMDVQAQMGITASATIKNQSVKQVCSDIEVAFPVLTISVCGDEDADTLLGALGISEEWEVISEEKAPKKMKLHFEMLSDGKIQKVDKCTYVENDETVEADVIVESESTEENATEENTTEEESTTEEATTEIITEEETTVVVDNKEKLDLQTIESIRKAINTALADESTYYEVSKEWKDNTEPTSLSEILESDTYLGKALVASIGAEEPVLVAECNKLASIYVNIMFPGCMVSVFCAETAARPPVACDTLFDEEGNAVLMKVPSDFDFDGSEEENEQEETTEKEEETTKTENTNSLKTYTTQNISGKGTVFQFDYYGKVTVRDLTNDDLGHFFAEDVSVNISNIRIRYMDIINTTDSIYNDGADYPWIRYISIEKMADTNLKDSNGNKLMIAKLKLDRLENPDTGEVEKATSFLKWQYYAIIPETTEKEYETSRLYDLYTKFSFEYDDKTIYFGVEWDQHYFCTDDYTEDTEEEIISLLSSFRVKE